MVTDFLRRILVKIGVIGVPALIGRIMTRYPATSDLPIGSLVLVKDGGLKKWVCFQCPGGCGEKIQLSLNPKKRPRWSIGLDWLSRPTIEPSVRQLNRCKCHFWVKKGRVEWCADSGISKQNEPYRLLKKATL